MSWDLAIHRLRANPDDTSSLGWFLERGADPNIRNPGTRHRVPLHGAVEHASPPVLRFLLNHGADPTIKNDDGRSPVGLAVRGDAEKVAILLEYGGIDDATPYDHLIGAAIRGDDDDVPRLAKEVDLSASTRDQKQEFLNFAQSGQLSAVKAMLLAGMDIAVTTSMFHGTALGRAALHGRSEMVRYLVEQSAPLEVKHQWGGTPLGSSLRGLVHFPEEDRDYAGVVDALLSAGAQHTFIKGPVGVEAVDRVLCDHGNIPEGSEQTPSKQWP